MSIVPDTLFHRGGVPIDSLKSWDVGNVYWVIMSTHPQYANFMRDRQGSYENDGTDRVHSTIQSALDATVTDRNDYVIVIPAPGTTSYYLNQTATLTMNKNHVHLICPDNIGTGGMGYKGPVVNHYGEAFDSITLTGNNCEIAGMFFRAGIDEDIISMSASVSGLHVHDCFFGMSAASGDTNVGIDAPNLIIFNIHDNHFTNFNPQAVSSTQNDITAFIRTTLTSTTRGIIKNNVFTTGANTAVASGINILGHDVIIDGNTFHQTGALGDVETGTFTKGITASANISVVNNVFTGGITVGNCITGPTADTCVGNFAGTNGQIRVDPDGSHVISEYAGTTD